MKNLLLVGILVLTIAINFQPCYGIICYICETREKVSTVVHEVGGVEEGIVVIDKSTYDPGLQDESPLTAPTTDPTAITETTEAPNVGGTFAPGPTPRPKEPGAPIILTKLTPCFDAKGKKTKSKLSQDECPSKYRACFSMSGNIFERQDHAGITWKIEKHGCFDTSDGQLMQQGKSGECVDIKTDKTSTAKLCVCDDENGGDMLCNRGVKKGCNNYNVFILAVATSMLLALN